MTFVTEALQEVEDEGLCEEPLTLSDQAVFARLWQIDDAYRLHATVVEEHISAKDEAVQKCDSNTICTMKPVLLGDQYSLQEQIVELRTIDALGDKAHEVWKTALFKSRLNTCWENSELAGIPMSPEHLK